MQDSFEAHLERLRVLMCRPVGTYECVLSSGDLFDATSNVGVILEVSAGQHHFLVEKDKMMSLKFYHSAPGTGTRVATIDLRSVEPDERIFLLFTWAPSEICLCFGTKAGLITSKGTSSERQFRIGTDGSVFELQGVGDLGPKVYQGGTAILRPTALNAWTETLVAIRLLETGKSDQGFAYDAVVSNVAIVFLVTGFEAYCKTRFIELEQEGIEANAVKLIDAIYSKKELEKGIFQILAAEALDIGVPLTQYLIMKDRINFQSFEKAKVAYNKAYDIKFGELGVSPMELAAIQEYFQYRHRVIHVSPMETILNRDKLSATIPPKFSSKAMALEAIGYFSDFVEKLHTETLKLRPRN